MILSPNSSLLTRRSFSEGGPSPLFPLHTNTRLVSLLFPLHTQKQWECTPPKNVGAPTFVIFPLIFRYFLLRAYAKSLPAEASPEQKGQPAEASAKAGFPRLFLSQAKFPMKLPRISQYTALTGPLSP